MLGERQYVYISSYRLYGYPLILAILYSIFGRESTFSWKISQALMDTATAVLIYFIAKKIFKKGQPAWIAYFLYLFNPYTSAYVGVRLTEITAIFLVTLIFYLFLQTNLTVKMIPLFLLAVTLGYLPQVRPGFLFFSLTILAVLLFRLVKSVSSKKIKIAKLVLTLLLFVLPFSYNTAHNLIYFKQNSPLTVDNLFAREFYVSLFIENSDTISFIPPQVNWIYQEYSTAKTAEGRRIMTQKYFNLALEEIKKDPTKFIANRFKKLWFVWEKHAIFPYGRLKHPVADFMTYWGNVTLLVLAIFGLWSYIKGKVHKGALLSIFLCLYISLLHAFSITAERFSLPAYPLIFLFTGFSLWQIYHILSLWITPKKS